MFPQKNFITSLTRMSRIIFLFIWGSFTASATFGQSFSIRDLLTLAELPNGDITHFMYKNGFAVDTDGVPDTIQTRFISRLKSKKRIYSDANIDLYQHDNSRFFVLHTTSADEYLENRHSLIRSGFIFDKSKNIGRDSSILFQKANLSVLTSKETGDSVTEYVFKLKVKKIPDSIRYAEELLQFDSHEFLANYFGEKNVAKDLFYFSQKDLKKCTVLFSGTAYQAAFVWGNESNLNNLSYVIISNVLPTKQGEKNGIVDRDNAWKLENGIHSGMAVRDVLKLNGADFYVYGNKSDLAFMVKPADNGKIDFKKTAIMFRCDNCYDNPIFDQYEVSALDIAKANLPLKVFDIIIYP